MCGSDIFLGIIAILFPPVAVWVKRGICSADSLINIALCCLGFIPGLLHAWYIIASSPDPTYEELAQQDAEPGNVTYYYVQHGQPQATPASGREQTRGYGTVNQSSAPSAQFPAGQQPPYLPGQQAGASSGQEEIPPSYSQAVQGDHKIQKP